MSSGRRDPNAPSPELDIPDLELPAAAPPRRAAPGPAPSAAPKPSPRPAATHNSLDYFGGLDHLDPDDVPAAALELDLGGDPRHAASQADFGDSRFDADDLSDALAPDVALAPLDPGQVAWPSGRSPERAALRFEPQELARIAAYPALPGNVLMTPSYALRVRRRRRALQVLLAERERELEAAEQARDRLLADMVVAHESELASSDRFRKLLAPIRDVERVAQERHAALAGKSAEHQAEVERLEATRARIAQERAGHQQKVDLARAELERAELEARRGEARYKRALIEIRAKRDVAAREAAAQAPPSGDHAAAIAAIEADARAQEPELAELQATRDRAHTKLASAEAELGGLGRAEQQAAAERRALDQRFGKELAVQSSEVDQARADHTQALADAGRTLLARQGAVNLASEVVASLLQADARVGDLALESEKLFRALDAYDAAAARRGVVVLAVLGVVVLALIMLAVLR
jgi:hypothetical protein